ncbi:MAG: class I SAM-dependent RNA methyltransferase [bacterium]|nr:class I SAM-dependent RNA methyltransferase [bacterium]
MAGGDGLARFDGVPIFVPRAAPGDLLRVRLVDRRTDYGRAEIVEILEPGPGRRSAPCPHFERCGGCDLQHLEEDLQLRLKAEAFRETLLRVGGIEMPARVAVERGEPWGYRMRTQLHVAESEHGPQVGYFARRSRELVAVDRCPVLVPELEQLLPRLPDLLRDQPHRRLDLTVGDDERWTSSPVIEGLPHGEVSTQLGELTYRYDARCFFQAHRQLVPALIEHAVGPAEGEDACDLFAGVGFFSLPLAKRYRQVIAVEGDRVAARFARNNARRNRLRNLQVDALAIDAWISRQPAGDGQRSPARVLVNPPRGGLSSLLRRWLRQARPQRLTYVSCHPATLARDLKLLERAFRIDSLALLDLFPQTGHMEAVVQLLPQELGNAERAARGEKTGATGS